MRFAAPTVGLLFLLASTPGCDRVLGIVELPHAQPTDAAVVDTRVPTACETCEDNCAVQRSACAADSLCASAWKCVSACPLNDPVCRKGCEDASPGWAQDAAYLGFDRCRRDKCMKDCYGTGGLLAALDASCGCADVACASQVAACVQSGSGDTTQQAGGCERHLACLTPNPNPDSFVVCDALDAGADEWRGLLACARNTPCSTSGNTCPLATGELACTGKFGYGQSAGTTQKLTFQVTDWSFTDPIVNATATACAKGACSPCIPVPNAGGTGVTDAQGNVTLTVPMGPNDYSGCIQVTPLPDQSLRTTLVFTGRKVHADEKLLGTVLWPEGIINSFGALTTPPVSPDFAGHGMFFGTAHDCLWWHPTGAFVSVDGGDATTQVIYLDSGGVASHQELGTTNLGAFGIFNVPPGNHVVTVTFGGKVISQVQAEAAAGKLTDVNTFPMDVGGN